MFGIINGQIEPILKVMKYSSQPVLFKEPLEDFLEVFGNINGLGNNLTKFPNLKEDLMEVNINPRIFMCQYAGMPKYLIPNACNSFYSSMTNEGFGYSFNKANFWDIFERTTFTELYAKVMRPKGHNSVPSPIDFDDDDPTQRWVYPMDDIFFPELSGPDYGLTVRIL